MPIFCDETAILDYYNLEKLVEIFEQNKNIVLLEKTAEPCLMSSVLLPVLLKAFSIASNTEDFPPPVLPFKMFNFPLGL